MKRLLCFSLLLCFLLVPFEGYAATKLEFSEEIMQRLGITYQNYPYDKSFYDRNVVQDSVSLRTAAHYGFLGQDGFLKPLFALGNTEELVPVLSKLALYSAEYSLVCGIYKNGSIADCVTYSALLADPLGETIKEGEVVCGIATKGNTVQYIWKPQIGIPSAMYKGRLYLAYWGSLILEQPHKLQYGEFVQTGQVYLELPCSSYFYNGKKLTEEEVVANHLDKTAYVIADAKGAICTYIY